MSDEIQANRRRSEEKIARKEYDVLLSYNSKDREQVIAIGNQLKDNGFAPWFDKWDLRPGLPWMPLLEEQIEQTKAAAIFIGQAGLGPWQEMERQMLLNQLVSRRCPVIPVVLENAPDKVKLPGFLAGNTWVDFRQRDPDPLESLIWGMTGEHPAQVYRPGILIASLGDSPAVVPAMYDLLTKQRKLTLNRIVVLHSMSETIQDAFKQVRDTLNNAIPIESIALNFEDANNLQQSCSFLQRLYQLLLHYEQQGESVYLSLAGGRKNMAALMAWVVPFFSCVKGLYHVIDKDKNENHFPSLSQIKDMSPGRQKQVMRPPIDQLLLVDIPCEGRQQIDQQLHRTLLEALPRDFEEAEAIITGRIIVQKEKIPPVVASSLALEQFLLLCKQDPELARKVHAELLDMHQVVKLLGHRAHAETCSYRIPGSSRVTLYAFTDVPGTVRPVFYMKPDAPTSGEEIEQIVICSLERADQGGYRTLKEVTKLPNFSTIPRGEIPAPPSPAESILVVPLGKSPMVATQLYTLLKERELHTIREVVLLYPQHSVEISNAARIVGDAFKEVYKNVLCTPAFIPGLSDVASKDDCIRYQRCLEDEIIRIQQTYPDCQIDLALSGGRKGMTAMTLFAAQRLHLPYVYHTLITDEALSEDIEEQTTVAALNKTTLTQQKRSDRLFLRDPAYTEGDMYPYEKFALFRVPVFSTDGWKKEG